MALNRWRRRFEGNERVDLPDFRTMLSRVYADFNLLIQQYIDNEAVPRVVKRYQEGTPHDTNIFKIRRDLNRAIQDFQQEWLYVNTDSNGTTEDLAVLSSTTNYIEVKIDFVNDDLQTRAFWDTDIGLTGQEFFDEINVRTRIDENFSVNQTGFQGGEWIPLFEVDVDGVGVVTDVRRADDLLWEPRTFVLPDATTRKDVYESSVKDLRSFIDFLGSLMSEVKGTDQLLEDQAWSNLKLLREYQNIFFSGGGTVSFADPNADEVAWTVDFLVSVAGRSDLFTIPAGAETVLEDECIYVDIPEAIVAAVDEIQTASQDAVPDSGDITLNHDGNPTAAIPFNASNTDIQNALNALPSLSAVVVTGDFLNQNVVVTFAGADGGQDQPLITVDTNNLLNGATPVSFSFVETTKGVAPVASTLTPVVAPLADVPIDPKDANHSPRILVLFYRKNNQVFGGMRIPILDSGESGTVGSDLPSNIRARLGIISETAFEAYPDVGGGLIDANDSYAQAIGKLAAASAASSGASNQDRNLKLVKGGSWAYNLLAGTPTQAVGFSGADDQGELLFDTGRWKGQSFDPSVSGPILNTTFRISRSGNPTGNLVVGLYADDGGGLPGALIATSDPIDVSTIPLTLTNVQFSFTGGPTINNGTLYHALVKMDQLTFVDIPNSINFQNVNSDVYAGGNIVKTLNGGTTFTDDAGLDSSFFEVNVNVTGGSQLAWSADAFWQIPGLPDNRNTIPQASSPISLADGEVAYVSLNRTAGAAANLAITIDDVENVVLDDNITVFARRCGDDILIGDDQTIRLRDGESQSLDSGLSDQTLEILGGTATPINEASSDPQWAGRGAPLFALRDTDRTFGAIANMDAEIDKLFGQLQIKPHPTDNFKVIITGADRTLRDNRIYSQEINNLIAQFEGAVLNFQTAKVRNAADSADIGDITFDPITVNEYSWMGVALVPSGVTADNRLQLEMLITPTNSSDAVADDAPKPAIAGSKKSGGVLIFNNAGTLEVSRIRQLGTGSGSGSGNGTGNPIYESLVRRATRSCYKFVTPNIFAISQETETDAPNTTATFDVANLQYNFAAAGEILRTITQLGSRFLGTSTPVKLEADEDLAKAELHLWYKSDANDPAPVARISRDGVEFQTVTMNQVGLSPRWIGEIAFDDEAVEQTTHEYPVANADDTIALTDTGTSQELAFPVVVTQKEVQQHLTLYMNKTGSPLGSAFVQFIRDDGGAPSTDAADIFTSEKPISIGTLSAGDLALVLDVGRIVTKPGTYWVRFRTNDTYKTSFNAGVDEFSIRTDSSSPTDPEMQSFDGATWAPVVGTSATYLLEGTVLGLFVEVESSQADVSLEAMGVLYGNRAGVTNVQGRNVHVERFDLSTNPNEFTIPPSKFLPNTFLKIYDVSEKAVYTHPAFAIDGQKITFPEGTFNGPAGTDALLIFEQFEGNGFDNSDLNAALMAANRLGSTDANLDRSVAGEGGMTRADNGVLVEHSLRALPNGEYAWVFAEVN